MKPRLQGYDITTYVYDGNLPKLLTDIAVHAFLYEHTQFGHDLVIVKSGLYQLEDKGFIGKGE